MERFENKYISIQCAIWTYKKTALYPYIDVAKMPISKT